MCSPRFNGGNLSLWAFLCVLVINVHNWMHIWFISGLSITEKNVTFDFKFFNLLYINFFPNKTAFIDEE